MKNFISVFIILLFVQDIKAQNFELGGVLGIGGTTIGGIEDLYSVFGQDADNNFKIGILASMNPDKTRLFINSGILMQLKGSDREYIENLKIPIGADAIFGREVGFILGAGFYVNWVNKTSQRLQLGIFADMGVKFELTNRLNMLLKFQMDYDLTPYGKDAYYSHAGQVIESYYNVRSMEYSVNLVFMYRLHKRPTKK